MLEAIVVKGAYLFWNVGDSGESTPIQGRIQRGGGEGLATKADLSA